jgi:hypothetical protein
MSNIADPMAAVASSREFRESECGNSVRYVAVCGDLSVEDSEDGDVGDEGVVEWFEECATAEAYNDVGDCGIVGIL